MIFIPVRESHYADAVYEAGDCSDGTRVLAWVNYLKGIGIKRYYISEKYQNEWYYVTVDVFPHDQTIWWNFATREASERDSYIDSVYLSYEDDAVVIYINDNNNDSIEYTEEMV